MGAVRPFIRIDIAKASLRRSFGPQFGAICHPASRPREAFAWVLGGRRRRSLSLRSLLGLQRSIVLLNSRSGDSPVSAFRLNIFQDTYQP